MLWLKRTLLAIGAFSVFSSIASAQTETENWAAAASLLDTTGSAQEGVAAEMIDVLGYSNDWSAPPPPAPDLNADSDSLLIALMLKTSTNSKAAAAKAREAVGIISFDPNRARQLVGEACDLVKQVRKDNARGLLFLSVGSMVSNLRDFEEKLEKTQKDADNAFGLLGCDGLSSGGMNTNIAEGWYTIRGGFSGKCLDVRDHSIHNAARLQQWECTGEQQQSFYIGRQRDTFYSLRGQQSGKCVSAQEVRLENGVPMITWDCHGGPDQLVKFLPSVNGTFKVQYSHSLKCMDVQDTSFDNGKDVHQWECDASAPDQNWRLVPVSGSVVTPPVVTTPVSGINPAGRYALTAQNSGRCLDVEGGRTDNTAPFQQWDCNFSGAQSFTLRDVGAGFYNIVHQQSGRCLSAEGAKFENGIKAILWDCNGGPDQKVRFEDSAHGSKRAVFSHSNKCMEVQNAGVDNGWKVQQMDCNGQANQNWILRPF